jgi:hypothetical protein
MRILPRLCQTALVLGALVLTAVSARAQAALDLSGASMTFAWRFGSSTDFGSNGLADGQNPTFTVGPGVEVPSTFGGQANIDITNSILQFNFTVNGAPFSPNAFNGAEFTLDPAFGTITGATIDGPTNMTGFDSTRISVANGDLFVNFEGLPFSSTTEIQLTVDGGATVPEPSTVAALMGCVALSAAILIRRRRKG